MHHALAETITLFERGVSECHRPEDRALVDKYLAALAPILAATVLGRDVLSRLDSIDRLFGHTWLHDIEPFSPAFDMWRKFRTEYQEWALRSMTINERLHALRLVGDFDLAKSRGDLQAMTELLKRVGLDAATARSVAKGQTGDA